MNTKVRLIMQEARTMTVRYK
jgi:hypothetical protein